MHPFKAGDVVVCIDDRPLPEKIIRIGEPWVKAGRAYRVASTSTCAVSGYHGLLLRELECWPPGAGWHAWRFTKIELADGDFVLKDCSVQKLVETIA
jgi:hypothetical protein